MVNFDLILELNKKLSPKWRNNTQRASLARNGDLEAIQEINAKYPPILERKPNTIYLRDIATRRFIIKDGEIIDRGDLSYIREREKMIIHSMVDCITNSSGTTYIFSDDQCVENAYKVLEIIMQTLGIDGKVDDYFEISNDFCPDYYYKNEQDVIDEYDHDRYVDLYKKINIKSKNNLDIDIAPLMDGLFKSFYTSGEWEMIFNGCINEVDGKFSDLMD